jgi:hypothetical protein
MKNDYCKDKCERSGCSILLKRQKSHEITCHLFLLTTKCVLPHHFAVGVSFLKSPKLTVRTNNFKFLSKWCTFERCYVKRRFVYGTTHSLWSAVFLTLELMRRLATSELVTARKTIISVAWKPRVPRQPRFCQPRTLYISNSPLVTTCTKCSLPFIYQRYF